MSISTFSNSCFFVWRKSEFCFDDYLFFAKNTFFNIERVFINRWIFSVNVVKSVMSNLSNSPITYF